MDKGKSFVTIFASLLNSYLDNKHFVLLYNLKILNYKL